MIQIIVIGILFVALVLSVALVLLFLFARRTPSDKPKAVAGNDSLAPYKQEDVDNFDWPRFFVPDQVRFLVGRVDQVAADDSERRLFRALLRRAYEDCFELEILYRELPGVLKNDPRAIRNFRDTLNRFSVSRTAAVPPPSPAAGPIYYKPSPNTFDNQYCRSLSMLGVDRVLLVAQGIRQISRGDRAMYESYANTLKGLWRQSQPLERLYRLALEGSTDGRDRLSEKLRLLGRDSRIDTGTAGLPNDGRNKTPDDPGVGDGIPPDDLWPQPGGGRVTWPDDIWPPDDGGGFPTDFHDYCYVIEPCLDEALNGIGDAVVPASSTSANGITSVEPARACYGGSVTIRGSFAKDPPTDVIVLIGDVQAEVLSWSNDAIEIRVPFTAVSGCVGFRYTGPSLTARVRTGRSFGDISARASRCSGHDVTLVEPSGGKEPVPCTGKNLLLVGPPVIEFLVNGSTDVTVEPNTELTLTWHVHNQDGFVVRRTSTRGPAADINDPEGNTLSLGPFTGDTPRDAVYELRAQNACGETVKTVSVHLRKTPALKIIGIEVVQAIQRFSLTDASQNNSVRLVADKRTMVRVYVESGINDNFDSGAGANSQSDVTGRIVFPGVEDWAWSSPLNVGLAITAGPRAAINRSDLTNTLNFELNRSMLSAGEVTFEARVWVQGHENAAGWSDSQRLTVTFQTRRKQRVVRILVADGFLTGPVPVTPTNADYDTSLQGATTRYPIGQQDFIVELIPGFETITTTRNLGATLPDPDPAAAPGATIPDIQPWSDLLDDIDDIADDAEPRDRVWAAIVPLEGRYILNGIGTPGSAETRAGSRQCIRIGDLEWCQDVPWGTHEVFSQMRFAARATLQGTFAHEMGHTFGIKHANCCMPDGETVDGRLPADGGIEDVGIDVAARTLIEAGRGEIMSYCGDTSRCPGATRWPSIAFWDIIFDALA